MRAKVLLTLLVAPALAGCPFMTAQPTARVHSQAYAGQMPLRVLNASSRAICYVHIAPPAGGDWGDDWLGSSETIPSGMMKQLGVAPGAYNVRLDDCQHSPMQVLMALDLTAPREVVIHDGAPPALAPTAGFTRLELVAMSPLPQPTVVSDGSGGGAGYDSAPPPPAASFEASGSGRAVAATPAPPAGPAHYSLTLHNSCPRTVGLYHGTGSGRPPFASGTYGSIGSNTTESFSGFAPETFWIVDDSRNGVSSFTASGGSQRVEIVSSCSGFGAY
jgi:hypothetical protein